VDYVQSLYTEWVGHVDWCWHGYDANYAIDGTYLKDLNPLFSIETYDRWEQESDLNDGNGWGDGSEYSDDGHSVYRVWSHEASLHSRNVQVLPVHPSYYNMVSLHRGFLGI
jgi:SH3-like domain-containing protein